MNPKELMDYLASKPLETDPRVAKGLPGVPALPGMEEPEMPLSKDKLAEQGQNNFGYDEKEELFNEGGMVKGTIDKVKEYLMSLKDKAAAYPGNTQGPTLEGFQNLVSGSSDTPKGYANGGIVDYFNKQRAGINKVSPEQMAAQEQALLKSRSSLGNVGAQALGGFADAIMQGVARAGNPGFQDRITANQEAKFKDAAQILPNLKKNTTEDLAANRALDKVDPMSAVSQHVQSLYGPVGKRLGVPTAGATQDQIENLLTTGLGIKKADAESDLAKATMGLKTQELDLAKQKAAADQSDRTKTIELAKQKEAQETTEKTRAAAIEAAKIKQPGIVAQGFNALMGNEQSPEEKLREQVINQGMTQPADPAQDRIVKIMIDRKTKKRYEVDPVTRQVLREVR